MMTDLVSYAPPAFIVSALMTISLSSYLHAHKLDVLPDVLDLSALVM